MTTNYWLKNEDIDADFAAISDLYDNSVKINLPSAQERKARSKPSLYIDDSPEEEFSKNGIFAPCGRGAAFLDSSFKLPGVGGVPSFLQKQRQEEITNDIRETSEFRFSSDDILQNLNQHVLREIHLQSSFSSKSSDSGHVSLDSPVKEISSNSGSSPSSPEKTSEEKPPPLYEILKSGRGGCKTKIKSRKSELNKNASKRDGNIEPSNICLTTTEKTYNINSKEDFPELQ